MKKTDTFMLTPKDISYFNDVLDQILVLKKRITHEITLLSTQEIIDGFDQVNTTLFEVYEDLLAILKEEAKK